MGPDRPCLLTIIINCPYPLCQGGYRLLPTDGRLARELVISTWLPVTNTREGLRLSYMLHLTNSRLHQLSAAALNWLCSELASSTSGRQHSTAACAWLQTVLQGPQQLKFCSTSPHLPNLPNHGVSVQAPRRDFHTAACSTGREAHGMG